MIVLNQEEKEIIKKVVGEMSKCGLFCGLYDAKNGSAEYMRGIAVVMEYLAYLVNEDYGEEFSNAFLKNIIKSEKTLDKTP